jgi:hypothetical protein
MNNALDVRRLFLVTPVYRTIWKSEVEYEMSRMKELSNYCSFVKERCLMLCFHLSKRKSRTIN